ncbi:MAG: hypothetical protein N5P05_000054 [Chroococcopsis gigantea SAG 12.99]|jgi:hypothetical protein|nr:hypothetical protein [Chlorogloea purpurea SAG 13.99]MDV2998448.1 hypothetical protein [Chroococcopsis gigantea SAG 12.99]
MKVKKINRNYVQISLVGSALTILLTGCPSGQPTATITQESPAPAPSASPTPNPSPSVPALTATTRPLPAGLIPSTNPQDRKATIARQRPDPFNSLPIQPTITVIPTIEPPQPPKPPQGQSQPVVTPKIAVAPPPPPNPAEARGVLVSGIIQLGNTPLAVVQAPGERTERRVTTGARLSNGQVLVKAIDTNPDNPSVTLEQYGISVVRRLGEGIQKRPPVGAGSPNPQAAISF